MKDLFFTILAIWIIWRIVESIQASRSVVRRNDFEPSKEGKVKVAYKSPERIKKDDNKEGEYVDYEEVK